MAQFDVHSIEGYGLVVDCQHDFLSDLRSRVVAPLRDPAEPTVAATRLNPEVSVDGESFRVAIQLLRAVETPKLGKPIASLVDQEFAIKAALDLLISGF